MRNTRGYLVAAILTVAAAAVAQVDDRRIPVYIKTTNEGGFTDPDKGRKDSSRDIVQKLRESKVVRLAAAGEAVVVLQVVGRDTKLDENHWLGRQKQSSVTVRLTAGEYTTDFTGTGGASGMFSGYGKAAGKVVKDLEAWVRTNDAKLRALSAEKFAPVAAPVAAPAEPAAEPEPPVEAAPAAPPSPEPSPSPAL